MKMVRCKNGHYYDQSKYVFHCPFCSDTSDLIPEKYRKMGEITQIGHGKSAEVYRIGSEPPHVLKVIPCMNDQAKYTHALHEVEIMEKLRDEPCVVQIRDYMTFSDEGAHTVFILMDFCTSFSDYLSAHGLTVKEALQIMIGLCDAILVCIQHGILHLDIHPKNMFADSPSEIRLGDFGHSLLTEEAKQNRMMRETVSYMAPEVYWDGVCSEQSELYSAGLIFYALFNQRHLPFMLSYVSINDANMARMNGHPFPPLQFGDKAFEEEIRRVAAKACAHQRKERYKSVYEMRADLQNILNHCDARVSAHVLFPADDVQRMGERRIKDSDAVATTVFSNYPPPVFDADSVATTCAPIPPQENAEQSDFCIMPDEASVATTCASIPPQEYAPHSCFCMMPSTYNEHLSPSLVDSETPSLWHRLLNFFRRKKCCERQYAIQDDIRQQNACTTKIIRPFPGNNSTLIKTDSGQLNVSGSLVSEVKMHEVDFSAVAPKKLSHGKYSMITIVMYEPDYRKIVDDVISSYAEGAQETRKGLLHVPSEASIRITLHSPDLEISDDTETGVWIGKYLNFSFAVCLPENFEKQQVFFHAKVYINGTLRTVLKFTVECVAADTQTPRIDRQNITSAFVSYASSDRTKVAFVLEGIHKADDGVRLFLDVETLRSGMNWQNVIYKEIEKSDIFYLCWSRNAKASRYVTAEWKYALEKKGIECIEPIPLETPDRCPPPKELEALHFNDYLLYIAQAQ